MADAQEFLSVLGDFFYIFMLFSVLFSNESLKNARITITHVYFSALTLSVSLESSSNNFLEPPQMLMTEKTCMLPIRDLICKVQCKNIVCYISFVTRSSLFEVTGA